MHAATPDAWSGSIPHTSPFHFGLFDAAANCHTSPIANSHSKTDEK